MLDQWQTTSRCASSGFGGGRLAWLAGLAVLAVTLLSSAALAERSSDPGPVDLARIVSPAAPSTVRALEVTSAIELHETADPSTFKAYLNRHDITRLFRPVGNRRLEAADLQKMASQMDLALARPVGRSTVLK